MAIVSIGIGNYQLRDDAAASFQRMRNAGAPDTKINSAYRSYDQQAILFRANYTSAYATSSKRDKRTWNGTPYWRRAPYSNYVGVAVPGSPQSNHEGATALDVDSNPASPLWVWMRDHAGPHGWRQTIATEAWHWEYDPARDTHKNSTPSTTRKKAKMLHFVVNDPTAQRGLRYVILMPDGRRCDYTSGSTDFPNAVASNIGNAIPTDEELLKSLQTQLRSSGPAITANFAIDYTKMAKTNAIEFLNEEARRLQA